MPPTITLEQAKGFSLFMMKAVRERGAATRLSIWRASTCFANKAPTEKGRVFANGHSTTHHGKKPVRYSSRHGSSESAEV